MDICAEPNMTTGNTGIAMFREHLITDHEIAKNFQFLENGLLVRCSVCNQLLEIYGNDGMTDEEELDLLAVTAQEVMAWHKARE